MMKTFTLFELLVVFFLVALVVIFIQPSNERYQQRSSQAYAKENLTRLHVAEQAFSHQHGTYTTNLMALGWKPMGKLSYHYGFPPVLIPSQVPRNYSGNYQYAVMSTEHEEFLRYFVGASDRKADLPSLEGNLFGHGVLEKDSQGVAFVAAAIANLDQDEALDRFVITDQGKIIHLCDDIRITLDDDPDCQHAIYNYGR